VTDKPRHRRGYRREETEQVEATCLTVAVTLGALMDDLCIVGGLVPSLIIDRRIGADPETGERHSGTNDLDVGLAIALFDESRYTEISRRLRQEDFKPDVNESGNTTPQRWKLGDLNVTVDFLMAPIAGAERGGRVQPLEGDFGALIAPGLELAFDEREEIQMKGHTLTGERVSRTIPVCGPAAFVALKALAFNDRGEPKDAYDLAYVLRRWPAGIDEIAERLSELATNHHEAIERALLQLANDFAEPTSIGPLRTASFEDQSDENLQNRAADVHGYVDDLLRAYHTSRARTSGASDDVRG
jgi:predicted nucleotidyltransferase